jgi:hypothetical protein
MIGVVLFLMAGSVICTLDGYPAVGLLWIAVAWYVDRRRLAL